jgi:hypothetical protein
MPLTANSNQSLQRTDSTQWVERDVKTMSNSPRIIQKSIRTPLSLIALFCMAVALAPHAVAQACGPSLTLNADQWTMVGIPCVPPAGKETIGDVFGPSLGTENYGVTWIAWNRVYDDSQCVVDSGPSDCYTKLTLASAATTGDAFWIYTTQQTQLQFSSITASTPGTFFQSPAKLSTDGNSRYYMFANPYSATVNWSDVLIRAPVFGIFNIDLTIQAAISNSLVSANVNYWNGNTYFTRDLTAPVATFEAKGAAWLEMLQPTSLFLFPSVDVNIRVLEP